MSESVETIIARAARKNAVDEVLAQVTSQKIETIRVCFVDQHGILRGKTIVAEELPAALNRGLSITSTLLLKDTSHTTVFPVWGDDAGFGKGIMTGASDLIMLPDPRQLLFYVISLLLKEALFRCQHDPC